MEATDWLNLVPGDEEDDEEVGFSCDSCIDDLLRDAPADCLYCRLGELDSEEDE